ncbi:F0F1 ATP synthase subunit delta [Buchnera aphidicola]|uniref:F0F1 ATP synthase subunit delta n=1 Tax=Buchnera aphidicola TaxID=9 RepID=UPI003BEEFA78
MLSLQTIARPYAQAIFQFAISKNSIKKWKNMLILMNQIACDKNIKHFLSGSVSPKYLSSFFICIGKEKFDQYGINFIKLLALNKRFNILNEILKQFLLLELSYENIICVQLTSSYSLQEYQIKRIHNILKKSLSGRISFTCKIDKSILDGIIIKIGNTVFDFSIRNHLKQLSYILKS